MLPDHARDACTLWVVHTYLTDLFLISPRLGVRSPTKGRGKTLLLDVLDRAVTNARARLRAGGAGKCRVEELKQFRIFERTRHRRSLLIDQRPLALDATGDVK